MDYKSYIENILTGRGRFNCRGYKERHHIKPKCLGGSDDTDNLIDLYAKEHYEVHRLLALENPNEGGLCYAWFMMSNGGGSSKKRFVPSPEQYEEAKIKYVNYLSESFSGSKNPMYGVHRYGEQNPMFGVHRYGELAPMYGKTHTEEAKNKMSKARTGVYTGVNHPFFGKRGSLHHASTPILQFTKDGLLLKEWESCGEAHRGLGLDKSGIIRCCNQQVMSCGGFVWVKKEDYLKSENYIFPNFKKSKPSRPIKPVIQLNEDGTFIKEWESLTLVSKTLNISAGGISQCCNHPDRSKTLRGYRWVYKEDYGK